MNPTPPEESRPMRRSPAHITRQRREGRRRRRSRIPVVLLWTILGGLVVVAAFTWLHLLDRLARESPRQTRADRMALVKSISKKVAEVGKNVPMGDVVVNSAVLQFRDGQLYLTGAVHNRSKMSYSVLHLSFDTFDSHHNRAGVLEGEVSGVAAGEDVPFEMGPANPRARTCTLDSVQTMK